MPSKYSLTYSSDITRLAALFHDLPGFVWVSTALGDVRLEILSAMPQASVEVGGNIKVVGDGQEHNRNQPADSGQSLVERLSRWLDGSQQTEPGLAFNGGLIGYLSYEARHQQILGERDIAPQEPASFPEPPKIQAGLYNWAVICNHSKQTCQLVFQENCPEATRAVVKARLTASTANTHRTGFQLASPFVPDQSRETYRQNFRRIQDYILAGDCYQVNYSQRFSSTYTGNPWNAYITLRRHISPPFSAFMRTPGGAILSFSPEQFIQVQGDQMQTAPIKGTRPRGLSPEEDQVLRKELAHSVKDRAENLMIVDLLRNDLSRHAVTGSVKVDKLFEIQSFHNVHHLVSTISARKKPYASPLQVLWDAFPGGSITGAPKKRAMEIIEELEPHTRSVYCGSVFWCSHSGNLNSSIAIRTLVCENGKIYCWGGGGIVADSEEEKEYQESVNKVAYFMEVLEREFLSLNDEAAPDGTSPFDKGGE